MAKSRILILSDDASQRATLARWLLGAGYAVELAESPRRASEVIAAETLNLALMGRHLTAADAELSRQITERIKRVVFITQPEKEGETGAELSVQSSSLSWPCSEQDLLDRVRSELESTLTVAVESGPQFLRFEGYTLDAEARSLLDAKGQEVTLTRAEFSLLLAFARQPGRVLSRDELTHVIAGRGAEPDDRSVDVLISRLRRKIEPDPKAPRMIVTMPGAGYKFAARPQAVAIDVATAVPAAAAAVLPVTDEVHRELAPALPAEARYIVFEKSSRSARMLRALVPAAVILVAALGWVAWNNRPASQQTAAATPPTSAPASEPAPQAERRTAA
ncbi:MAG TPA: response regulator transcription factor, partial [Bradyrhizobium sp.]|nr:response regulator transcription factor [Bradyrhizobium sp.]